MAGTKYHVKEKTSVDLDDGRVRATFAAGDHVAKNDVEEEALEHLVAVGAAKVVSKAKED